jgi:hypothetical protein
VTVVERNDQPLAAAEMTEYCYDKNGNLDLETAVNLPLIEIDDPQTPGTDSGQ